MKEPPGTPAGGLEPGASATSPAPGAAAGPGTAAPGISSPPPAAAAARGGRAGRAVGLAALAAIVAAGVVFRFADNGRLMLTHDEAYTVFRANGGCARTELFSDRVATPVDLRRCLDRVPGWSGADTARTLARAEPQLPPVYFLVEHAWLSFLPPAPAWVRAPGAALGLLALPLLFLLASELLASRRVGALATALFALSPLAIDLARTARPYGPLMTLVVAATLALVRARAAPSRRRWVAYALLCALGLWTHLLFALAVVAHGVALLLDPGDVVAGRRGSRTQLGWLAAAAAAGLLFAPWAVILAANHETASATTHWTDAPARPLETIVSWLEHIGSLLFEPGLGPSARRAGELALPVLALVGVGLFDTRRRVGRFAFWLLLFGAVGTFLALALPDVALGGRRSLVARYFAPAVPFALLPIAYALARPGRGRAAGALAVLVLLGGGASWSALRPRHNPGEAAVRRLNHEAAQRRDGGTAPVAVTDEGDNAGNVAMMPSLSQRLRDDVRVLLLRSGASLGALARDAPPAFVFNPSSRLRGALDHAGWSIEPVSGGAILFRLTPPPAPTPPRAGTPTPTAAPTGAPAP